MSAYSASAPVTASTTDAERDERDAAVVDEERDGRSVGESARRIARVVGDLHDAPDAARIANQTDHHRPEQRARPRRCRSAGSTNSTVRITSVIGTTSRLEARRGDLQPLDRRQHGDRGRDHAVAVEQRRAEDAERDQRRLAPTAALAVARWTSAMRAMMPPSPSLSARMMNVTYLTETMSVIAQKTSEMTP